MFDTAKSQAIAADETTEVATIEAFYDCYFLWKEAWDKETSAMVEATEADKEAKVPAKF